MRQGKLDPLLGLVERYFVSYLQQTCGASPHTIRSYRDGLQLFFLFLSSHTKKTVANLRLDDIRSDHVLAFLEHIESKRSNQASTRNCRLAAIHGLVSFILQHDLSRASEYNQILVIPAKRSTRRPASYLEPEEVRAILSEVGDLGRHSLRDRALILFLYNTGARISEALAVRAQDIQFERPPRVRLMGKGGKERDCPLWSETVGLLRRLITRDVSAEMRLFSNRRGESLTRDGAAYILAKYAQRAAKTMPSLRRKRLTPHILRHSCAVALLQAGVDLTVIRDYLGHSSITTTNQYVSTNFEAKKKALLKFWKRAGLGSPSLSRWHPSPNLLSFLQSL